MKKLDALRLCSRYKIGVLCQPFFLIYCILKYLRELSRVFIHMNGAVIVLVYGNPLLS